MGESLPDSPAGRAGAWLMEAIGRAAHIDAAELEQRFHPGFLHAVPPDRMREFLVNVGQVAAGGAIEAVEATSGRELDWLVATGEAPAHVQLAVEPAEPHRIVGLKVQPHDAGDGAAVPVAAPVHDEGTLDGPARAVLDRWLADEPDRLRLVGVHATVLHPGGVHHAHRGWATVEGGVEWGPGTGHRIGSVAKTFTAALVVDLAGDGRLGLDDPVAHHLSEIDVPGDVTVRHLLTHTGGLDAPVPPGLEGEESPVTLAQLLADGIEQVAPPGDQRAYSNVGFALLGQLVEDVTGTPFAQHARTALFEPLGMAGTWFGERADAPAGVEVATGYSMTFGQAVEEPWIAVTMPGAGGCLSTPADMARWMAAVAGGHPICEVQDEVPGERDQALGISVIHVKDHHLAWHNGGFPGWSTTMWVSLEHDWGVYLATNTDNRTGGPDDLDRSGALLAVDLIQAGES